MYVEIGIRLKFTTVSVEAPACSHFLYSVLKCVRMKAELRIFCHIFCVGVRRSVSDGRKKKLNV
jgi:hypothetical protein